MTRQCQHCEYWLRDRPNSESAICQLNPPVLVPGWEPFGDPMSWAYPMTLATDRCSHWTERTTP